VLNERARAGSDELIEHCRKSLAPYKVPSQINLVAALPRTTVGKIDSLALRAKLSELVQA
jgi:long-chain acyl-CoA synthetase